MTHKRTSIRSAIVSALTGLATCGSRVYPSRLKPLAANELPAILVSTGAEETPEGAWLYGNKGIKRTLDMQIAIVVKAVSGFEDTADTILEEIEARLFDTPAHNNLGGIVHSLSLASIADPEMDDSTDKPVVRLLVILRVIYSS